MASYPLLLDLAGKAVLVVGAGRVATRRAAALVDAAAEVTVIAPDGTPEMAALPVDWQQRRYANGDIDGKWWLVHAATDDTEVNAAVAAAAAALGVWCVRADAARQSAAWVPAVLRDREITVAVNAGHDPRLAIAVRDGLREFLPQILTAARETASRVD